MRVIKLGAVAVVVALLASLGSIILYPSAQDFMRTNPFWNGIRDFCERYDVEMVPSVKGMTPQPGGSVLILIPYMPYDDEYLGQIASFARDGGTLIIMDDYGYGNQVLSTLELDMEFDGDPLLDPYLCHQNQWLPKINDLAGELEEEGIQELILNYATALNVYGDYQVLARTADTAFLDRNRSETRDEGDPGGPLAVAARAEAGEGTVIAISDPSILINSMVGRGGNGAFMEHLAASAGDEPRIALDTSRIPRVPLDRSKDTWQIIHKQLSSPYPQVLLVALILTLTTMPLWRKGA